MPSFPVIQLDVFVYPNASYPGFGPRTPSQILAKFANATFRGGELVCRSCKPSKMLIILLAQENIVRSKIRPLNICIASFGVRTTTIDISY